MLKKTINNYYIIVIIIFLCNPTHAQNKVLVDTSLVLGNWLVVDYIDVKYIDENHSFSESLSIRKPWYRKSQAESLIIEKSNQARIIYPPTFWREAIPAKFKVGKNPYKDYVSYYQYSLRKTSTDMYFFRLDSIKKGYYIDKYGYEAVLMIVNSQYLIIGNILEDSTNLEIAGITVYIKGEETIEMYLDDQTDVFCLIKAWFKEHNINLKAKSIKCHSD